MKAFLLMLFVFSGAIDAATLLTASEHQRLSKIEQQMNDGDIAIAQQRLTAMVKGSVSATAFLTSRQMLARLYADQGEYEQALLVLAAATKLKRLSAQQRRKLSISRAKMHYALEQWARSAALFEGLGWHSLALPEQVLLGNSLVKLTRYKEAARVLSGLEKTVPAVPEAQLQLLLQARQKAQQSKEVVLLLRKMLTRFPLRERYWLQLAKHYQVLGEVKKATTVLHSAYLQGVLNSQFAIRKLAVLLQQQGAPIQASEVLSQAMESGLLNDAQQDWSLLARMQLSAKNYIAAQRALEQALSMSDDVNNQKMLVSVLLYRQQWQQAYDQLQGLMTDPAQALHLDVLLPLIRASYHLNKTVEAAKYLAQAMRLEPHNSKLKDWQQVLASKR